MRSRLFPCEAHNQVFPETSYENTSKEIKYQFILTSQQAATRRLSSKKPLQVNYCVDCLRHATKAND